MNALLLRVRPTRLYISIQAIVLAAITSPAFANDTTTDRVAQNNTLPKITLKASKKANTYTGKKASTSTKLDLSLKETPQSITIVTRKQIDDMGATNLGELLTQTTGIVMVGDNTERTAFSIRGFGTGDSWGTSTLQQDGVATNSQNVSVSKPDMAMYETVEVMRGAAGLMQGSGEPSGAINLIRKKPTAEFQASGTISYGRWSSIRGEFDVSNKLNSEGTVRGRFITAYQDADSFMTAVTRDTSLLYGVVSADLSSNTLLNIGITHQQEHAVPVNSLPRYKNGSDIGLDQKNCGCSAWNFWDKENTNLFVDVTHQFNNGWSAKGTFSKSWVNMDMTFTNLSGTLDKTSNQPDITTGPFMYDYAYRYKQKVDVWDAFAKGPFHLFGREHELVVGINAQDSSTPGQWTDYYKVGLVDVFNTNPYQQPYISPRYDKDGGKSFVDQKQHGGYITTRLNIADPFKAILGLRLSNYEYLYGYENNDVSKATYGQRQIRTKYKVNSIKTPYIGLVYDINDTYSVYASYADVFLPQSVKDINDQLLDPMQGATYETGIKAGFRDDSVIASLAFFRIEQSNRSIDDLSTKGKCLTNGVDGYCKVAGGEVISEGIETELRGEVLPNLNISVGYTYNKTEYGKDPANQGRVFNENTPEHLARLFATYKLPNRLTIGGGVNYQSDWEVGRYSIAPAKQPGYALVNLMASYPINDHLTVAFNASNVFDKKYYSYITSTSNRYGDPANVKLSLRAKF
jgi:iron complex outermembrane receptor protein/outer membrane receptor for ferric coprogen and ferric-rhodotorulic acid